jgi:hypothetical protein
MTAGFLITGIFVLIEACMVIAATVAAVLSFRRGESMGQIMKTWFTKVIDALSGIGCKRLLTTP